MTFIWLLVGLGLIVLGADWLVEGASSIARRAGVSEFVIGLTIVGFGTSCPELVVSLTGALEGNADIAVGNVIGSNIFNVLFILGLTALLCPVTMTQDNRKKDIPLTLTATVLYLAIGLNHSLWGIGQADSLSRWEGALLLAIFAGYIVHSFVTGKPAEDAAESKPRKLWIAILMVLAGLSGLIFGGNLFVNSATELARMLGVSDKFIAITVLAMGTSLPEFVTSIVALAKKRSQMALGNILGSNVFNLLLILGVSAVISPTSFARLDVYDYAALFLSIILVWTGVYTGKKDLLDRFDASLLLLVFVGYMIKLFATL
jgi:cation:H+ antiporter